MSDGVVELPTQAHRQGGGAVEFERTPPQDVPAEQSVLGGMLLSRDAIADVVEVLKAPDFYRPAHQTIYEAILDLYGKGEPADPITVSSFLQKSGDLSRIGGAPYLHTLLSSVPTAANAGWYAKIVAEQAVLRRLVEAGTRIVQLGYAAGGGEVDDIVDRAQQAIYDVTERRSSEDYTLLEELMQPTMDELEAISDRSGQMSGVPTGFADLDALTNGLHPGQLIVLAGRPGMGKALALDTPLPTPSGWTTMGEVQVGDQLVDADGRPTRVVAATDVLLDRPCYELTFDDGTTVVADALHLWRTHTRAQRRAAVPGPGSVRTTEQLAATVRCGTADRRVNHSVPTTRPLELPAADLPIPPYTFGAWLGAGDGAGASLSTADSEMILYIEAEGVEARPNAQPSSYSLVDPTAGSAAAPGPSCPDGSAGASGPQRGPACRDDHATVTARLRRLSVLGDKHIPAAYLRASVAQRRALLAGLLDIDGTVTPGGGIAFTVTSQRLVQDVHDLVVGLGYRCTVRERSLRGRPDAPATAYTLTVTTAEEVFRLERKKLVHKERCRAAARTGLRYLTEVRAIPSVPVRCVTVDNEDHMYLATRSMVPTHNSTAGLDIARSCSIKNGMTSAIFSLEMSKTEITMRLLSAEARVPLHHMRSGMMTDDDWARLARRMGEVAEAPLFIDDSPNLSMMEIRAKARRLKQRHDLRLVVIDYLQLMSGNKKAESRQQEVSELSRQLKLLAKELEVPVIAMSQLNRGPEQRTDKKPQLSDLRESGSIEQDADMVVLLHREDVYEKESPRAGEADFIVAKHRNGPTDTITVAFQGHYSRFVDMTAG
ncbi:MAG: replicative helicase [Frankiales bacterium]|nr:replicative helicase [Frankiales bacterium]